MKLLLPLITIVISVLPLRGQSPDISRKFGKVTDYEINMTSYEKDTSAHAVVLWEEQIVKYDLNHDGAFKRTLSRTVRIKILDENGSSAGDVSIPYYNGKYRSQENVIRIQASSYNLEGGKVVKKQLDRKMIFRENSHGDYYAVKFSIPEVRAGSVIEYKYDLQSDFALGVPTITFQHGIPVAHSYAFLSIPDYYLFSINTKGFNPIKVERGTESAQVLFEGNALTIRNNTYKMEADHIPALRDEDHVWCKSDFLSAVEFELNSINYPWSVPKVFNNSWRDVNLALEKSDFSTHLQYANPFRQEVGMIMASAADDHEKIRKIHKLVMSRINWNESYRLITANIKEALKTGTGNNAEINFVLHSALKSAGYKVEPVLLSPRHYGRLPITRPSIDAIGTFILRVTLDDGSYIYLDGTDRNSDANMLPLPLKVDRARVYMVHGEAGWVDLTKICNDRKIVNIMGSVDESGLLTAKIETRYYYSPAFVLKYGYGKADSEDAYVESLEDQTGATITNYSVGGLDSYAVIERYDFTLQLEGNGDVYYMNCNTLPFITSNPFTQQERKLPVEFNYGITQRHAAVVTLPEGYTIDEIPENMAVSVCDKAASYGYMSQASGNALTTRSTFSTNRVVYPAHEFEELYAFFGYVADAGSRRVVIRKQ